MTENQISQETDSFQHSSETADLHQTGIPWLGKIPSRWGVSKVKWQFSVQLGKMLDEKDISGENLAPYLRNKDVQWWDINTEDLPQMDFDPAERRKYNLRSGDVLVCEGGEIGRSAIWTNDEIECYYQKALHRVRPLSSDQNPKFFCYFMQFTASNGIFVANTNRSTIDHLTAEKLKNQEIPNPPEEEQKVIVDFLDRRTARIDALVSKQKRLLDLLAEKRQAFITQAVAKGLDSTVATKSTEVQWLGKIPVHWDTTRTRFVARLESGHTPSRSNDEYWEDCNIPWITTSDIKPFREGQKIYLEDTEYEISQLGLENSGARILPGGTVFVSRTASVGFSGIMADKMATSQDFANWVCGGQIIPEYLLYVFRSMTQEFDRLMQGSTHQTIYMPDIRSFKTPLPPIEEQREIVEHIQSETEQLWNLIDDVERSIDLLKEKRQALITAAVTGQIDVNEGRGEIQDQSV